MVQGYRSLYFIAVALFALGAHAAPAAVPYHSLSSRQTTDNQPFSGPQTIQTHNVIPVTGGSVVEDCTITLTPVVVNGENLVREERKCTDLFVPGSSSDSSSTSTADSTTASDTTTTTTTTTTASTADTTSSATDTGTASDTSSTTTTDSTGSTSTDSSTESTTTTASDSSSAADATTTSSDTSQPTDTPPTTADPAASTGGAADSSSSVVVLGSSSVPASATTSQVAQNQNLPSGSLANDSAPTSTGSGVAIPGKKFEVLPIGLGVFAGISVIALIVVGLVTYERTKYRKAFRQRRLAASGAEMGYGGMAERR